MKYLSLLSIVLFSIAAQAQTKSAAADTRGIVTAELTRKIDSKNAHVGDAIEVRTTNSATLPDGTQLPKGTSLAGKVTEVRAKSATDKSSHLAFSLDRAILRDGSEVPIHATLGVMSVLSAVTEKKSSEAGYDASNSMPGLRGPGGAAPVGNLIAGLTNGSQPTAGQAKTTTGNAAAPSAGQVSSGPHIDHAPVGHLPGVTFSSALLAADTASLDATGQNISVESWAQMTLIVRIRKK